MLLRFLSRGNSTGRIGCRSCRVQQSQQPTASILPKALRRGVPLSPCGASPLLGSFSSAPCRLSKSLRLGQASGLSRQRRPQLATDLCLKRCMRRNCRGLALLRVVQSGAAAVGLVLQSES